MSKLNAVQFIVNDLQLAENFELHEFACKDGTPDIILDMRLVSKLQELRWKINKPITITSGYRNPEYNKEVDGVPDSQHLLGKAADIRVVGMTPTELSRYAKMVGFNGIGIYERKNFLHVDVRDEESHWIG